MLCSTLRFYNDIGIAGINVHWPNSAVHTLFAAFPFARKIFFYRILRARSQLDVSPICLICDLLVDATPRSRKGQLAQLVILIYSAKFEQASLQDIIFLWHWKLISGPGSAVTA